MLELFEALDGEGGFFGVGFFGGAGFAVVFDAFLAADDVVGVGGLVAQVAAEFSVLLFGPFGWVGVGFVEAGFDVGVGSGGALQEPIGVG